jgi:hypothetical protein
MTLYLACAYIQIKETWPLSRAELYESFFEEYYDSYRALQNEHKQAVLGKKEAFGRWQWIAYLITSANRGPWTTLTPSGISSDSVTHFRLVLSEGTRCGVLVLDDVSNRPADLRGVVDRSAEGEPEERVRFSHHRFQEYFTARYLAEDAIAIDWLRLLDQPRWQETMINLAAITGRCPAVEALAASIAEIGACSGGKGVPATVPMFEDTSGGRHSAADDLHNSDIAEQILADRVELGSRLIREVRGHVGGAGEDFRRSLLGAIRNLSKIGNPSTQVRMLWAARNLSDVDLYEAIKHQLASETAWVREQALMVLAEFEPSRRGASSDLAFEIGIGLATGEFLRRAASYARAVVAARRIRAYWSLARAVLVSCCQVVALIGTAVFCYLEVIDRMPWLQMGYGILTSDVLGLLLVSSYGFVVRSDQLSSAVSVAMIVSLAVVIIVSGMSKGYV